MTTKPTTGKPFDLAAAGAAVQLDTEGVLGEFLDGQFTRDDSIGDSTWRSDGTEFFVIRWRFVGKHMRPIPGFGHTEIPKTENQVTVSGLTLVENRVPGQPIDADLEDLLRAGTVVFHRFIDWLAVFAQIGVLHLGRPMSISEIDFKPPTRSTSRVAGYNDRNRAAAGARLKHWPDDPTD